MKGKVIYTGGQQIPGLRFQGEMMKCGICGKEQRSDPAASSGWTGLELPPDRFVYICTDCFPDHRLPKRAYREAFAALLRRLLS